MNVIIESIGILIYLVLVAQKINMAHASASPTFSISLQSERLLSLEGFARYEGNIPRLEEFTVCHWDKIQYFSPAYNNIWNYCYTKTSNSSLFCIQVGYALLPETANRHTIISAWFGTTGVIEAKVVPFQHRSWNHICWSYSRLTKENSLYFNGKLLVRKKYAEMPIIEGKDDVYASEFVIGQESDTVGGDYDYNQLYSGEIAGLNMWNYVLDYDTIKSLGTCRKNVDGNVIAWIIENWNVNQGKINHQLDANIFCQYNKHLVVFPTRQPLQISKTICATHGGKIATPMSSDENKKIKDLVEMHPECVSNDKTHHKNWGTLAWLGTKRVNQVWYEATEDALIKRLDYSLWSIPPNVGGGTSIDCSYMKPDGSWMYSMQNNGSCPKLDICTVCSIENTPVFTFKGFCESSVVDWNYYMARNNTTGEVTHYDGYKRGPRIYFKQNTWTASGRLFNLTMPRSYKTIYPVGRSSWYSFDANCPLHDANVMNVITFSRCEFGQEYTCNSGHCIDIQKKCNRIQDCRDNSDEEDCSLVVVPHSYEKTQFPDGPKGSNGTTPLIIHVSIDTIHLIDTTEMIMELTIKISIKWADGRLRLKNLPNNTESLIPTTTVGLLWHPFDKINHDNAMIGKIHKNENNKRASIKAATSSMPVDVEDPFEDQIFDSYENMLEMNQTFRIPYICAFYLQKFPFDTQSCDFLMHIPLERDSNLLFIKKGNGIFYDGPKIIDQFEIGKIASNVGVDGSKIWFKYNIKMRRLYNNQIINTIFPTCLLWLLAFSTLFINVENFNNRIMVSVTSLLVLSSLLGSINRGLPKTSYLKYIDLWFLWYITNIFLIIISHIIIDKIPNILRIKPTCPTDVPNLSTNSPKRKLFNRIAIAMFPSFTICFSIIYLCKTMERDLDI